jgi:hypothetical protein
MVQPYSPKTPIPAAEEVREWDYDTLLGFLSTVLMDDGDKTANIDGDTFCIWMMPLFQKSKAYILGHARCSQAWLADFRG